MSVSISKIIRNSNKCLGPLKEAAEFQSVRRAASVPGKYGRLLLRTPERSTCLFQKRSVHVAPPRNVVNAAVKIPSPMEKEEDVGHIHEDMAEEENGRARWLRKADYDTQLYHVANSHNTRMSLGRITLNSAKPLDYQKVVEAFSIVQRGCVNLRMGLSQRGHELWVKEYLDSDIDFKVLPEDTDSMEVVDQCVAEGFSSTDKPHMRVRLVPKSKDTPCVVEEVKENYPYQYDYIIHINHAFADGINVALVVHLMHIILDKLLAGKSFESKRPFGDLSGLAEIKALEEDINSSFCKDPNHLARVVDEMPPQDKSSLLLEAFGRPQTEKAWTKHTTKMIDSEVLDRFHEKSKEAGVTFNSSYVALINTAFVDLMTEAGIDSDSYRLDANHLINLRRYCKQQKGVALGALQHPLSHTSTVSKNVKNQFWEYTKDYHKDLNRKLKSGSVLEQKVVSQMMAKTIPLNERFTNPKPVRHDFGVSNIGDMTAFIPGTGKHVQVTDLVSFNILHNFIHSHMHQIISYRGCSRYTISYDTSYMTEETANKIADRVISLMGELSK